MTRKLKNMVTTMIVFIVATLELLVIYLLNTEGIEKPSPGFILLLAVLNLIFLISTTNYLNKAVNEEINLSIDKAKGQELTTFLNRLHQDTDLLTVAMPLRDKSGEVIGKTTMCSEISNYLKIYKKNNNLI